MNEPNAMNQNDFDLEALLSEFSAEAQRESDWNLDELNMLLEESPSRPSPEEPEKREEQQPAAAAISVKEKAAPGTSLPSRNKRKALVAGLALLCVVLLALGVWGLSAVLDPYDNRILPGTTLGGIDVGGMTPSEARKAVKAATQDTFTQRDMIVTLPDGTITLSPEETKVTLNTRAAVKAAYQLGRKEGTEAAALSLLPHLKLDSGAIRSQLETYADQHNVPHTELSYRLDGQQPPLEEDRFSETNPHQNLLLTLGTPLEELDVEAVLKTILDAYGQNTFQVTIDSIAHQTQPKAPDLSAIAAEFHIDPVNTALNMEAFQAIPGSYGYTLDLEAGEKLLAEAGYGETVAIPMTYVAPEILGDEVYFRDELGYCETKHTSNEDRNTNLKLACAALDGQVLRPGETFSYNDTVGQRTAEKGYKPAPAYSGTRTVNSVGGGVCQVSSTLYYATLLADMEIVQRVNHGFRSSYIGVGLDATVSWGGPDFQFRNNYHFPIMIRAEVSDGFVKVKLLGIDEKDYYVKMTSGYSEDAEFAYAWSYKHKFDKETDELISKEKEAYSCYFR